MLESRDGQISLSSVSEDLLIRLQTEFSKYLTEIFGLKDEVAVENNKLEGVLQLLADIRTEAKSRRDFLTSDKIRNQLLELGIQLKDEKGGGVSWTIEK